MWALTNPLPAWRTPKTNAPGGSGQVFAPAKPAFPTSMLVSADLNHKCCSIKKTDHLYGLRRFEPYSIPNGQDPWGVWAYLNCHRKPQLSAVLKTKRQITHNHWSSPNFWAPKGAQGPPFHLQHYVQLVDINGRAIRENKRGFIDKNLPPTLKRLNITSREWLIPTTQFESEFKSLFGCKENLMLAQRH